MEQNDSNIILTPEAGPEHKGLRLDKFLALTVPDVSRSQVQRLIEQGMVSRDDDVLADNSYKVRPGDSYQIEIPPPEAAEPEPEDIPLEVVYEDEDLIVVNKPAGMTVHPAPGAFRGTLVNALLYHCRDNLSGVGGVKRPGIVHRIDKDTSGLLVAAKNDRAHRGLAEQFAEHSIERTYHAVVYGVPNPLNGRIEGNIGRSRFDRKTLKACGLAAALVQCNLETGRTHQIRVHLASIGCNLIGDQLYVKNRKSCLDSLESEIKNYVTRFPRQALHAKSLGFVHPRTGEFMQFDSDYPCDFNELADKLSLL